MRSLIFATSLALALTTAAAAQQGAQQGAQTGAVSTRDVQVDVESPTHEMCKSVMDKKMKATFTHQHTGKMNMADIKKRPLTKVEMDKVHAKCAAQLARASKK